MIYLLMPSGKHIRKRSLEEWFHDFGLDEKPKNTQYTKEDVEAMEKKSLEIANKIIQMDKRRGK